MRGHSNTFGTSTPESYPWKTTFNSLDWNCHRYKPLRQETKPQTLFLSESPNDRHSIFFSYAKDLDQSTFLIFYIFVIRYHIYINTVITKFSTYLPVKDTYYNTIQYINLCNSQTERSVLYTYYTPTRNILQD